MEKYKYWKVLLVFVAFIALVLSIYSLYYAIMVEEGSDVFKRIIQVLVFLSYIIYYFYQRKKNKQNI